jgi:hypothetical protein
MKAFFSGRRNVLLLIGFVLIVAFVVKTHIDQKEKEKALPSFEKSIETANALLTADLKKLPGRTSLSLPDAEGKYGELVRKFNTAVEDYYYKLVEYRDCASDLSLMPLLKMSTFGIHRLRWLMTRTAVYRWLASFVDILFIDYAAIYRCVNVKKEYYDSLSKLKSTYKEVSKVLNPTVKLITKEKDERFKGLDEFLDEVERASNKK